MPDLIIERDQNILNITFNRPQVLNAFTWQMLRECKSLLEDARRDKQLRVVIFRGAGDHFCTGADIRFEASCTLAEYREFVSDIQDVTRALQNMDALSIAAIQGFCLGGGMELACACDFRIAADDARLGFPEVGIGLTATSGVAHLLPRLVGWARAKELLLTGDWVTAQEAEHSGLVNRTVARDDLFDVVSMLAQKLTTRSPLAVAVQKHLLTAGADASLDSTLRAEVDAILTVFASHDGQEGMRAFIEKRAPQFKGE